MELLKTDCTNCEHNQDNGGSGEECKRVSIAETRENHREKILSGVLGVYCSLYVVDPKFAGKVDESSLIMHSR